MTTKLNPPLTAKNGHTIKVLVAGRVSNPGPGKQSIESLDDQEALLRGWLTEHTEMPFEATVIAGKGSGEILDRDEYRRLIDLVETGEFDLVLCEDLSRICRRLHAHLFAEFCVDYDTRLISRNDYVDTSVAGWEDRSIFSSWHHERANRDTSDRIKRAHRGRFVNGGALRQLVPGIIKPPGAKSDADLYWDPYWAGIYGEWFTRLENGQSYAFVGDWLNSIGVPTGGEHRKVTKKKKPKLKYDGKLVAQRTRNPIFKGVRVQNERMSKRVNQSGHRKSVPAPPELRQERFCENLVLIEPERYDRIIALLDKRHEDCARGRKTGIDCRRGVSRKRTRFPGQCAYCGICGRLFVFGAHGMTTSLMCSGAREYKCWVGTPLNGPLAASKIAEAVAREIEALGDFDPAFEQEVNLEANRKNDLLDSKIQAIDADLNQLMFKVGNYVDEIGKGNKSPLLRENLAAGEAEIARLRLDRDAAIRSRVQKIVVPSAERLRDLYRQSFQHLTVDSYEFAHRLRLLVPRIVVSPVQLIDGGKIVLRARFRLSLASLLPDVGERAALERPLERVLTVDLFEPPQREKYRRQIVELRQAGHTQAEAATQLGLTLTAAQRAAALQRSMDELGLSDPYVAVVEPPNDTKLRRHRHERYSFEPLSDTGQL